MKVIIDTHVLLWWLDEPKSLSKEARDVLAQQENIVYVSAASTWEIAIKQSLGKLKIPKGIEVVLEKNSFTELSISILHSRAVAQLPSIHGDPFDRLLIAQTICEKASIITRDKIFSKYHIPVIKA